MVTIGSREDAGSAALKAATIAILGYGNQGRAHALNLRDYGFGIVVGARPGGSAERLARADGFMTLEPGGAVAACDLVALLTPDVTHGEVYRTAIAPHLRRGAALVVAHGFSIHYHELEPRHDIDVVLVAPKANGKSVRRGYENGAGVPCLFAVRQDATGEARARALAYAAGIGAAKAGLIETSFAEETETDLFGEQAVLCGGVPELVAAGFETLVEAGYQPEIAYFECLHELKLVVDLMYEGGISKMVELASDTARYGREQAGRRVINAETRQRMRELLEDIQDGRFARAWTEASRNGRPELAAMLDRERQQPIEKTGAVLRRRMAWLAACPDSAAA